MKLLNPINQNIPVWAVIKGDHACGDLTTCLNVNLITKPDFMNSRENALRLAYLKNTKGRKWLHDYLLNRSFGLYEITEEDLATVLSVWRDENIMDIAKEYKKAYNNKSGFEYKKIKKPWEGVHDVCKRKKQLKPLTGLISEQITTDFDVDLDYYRTIWMQRKKDNKWQIIDGTHRIISTIWQYQLSDNNLPKMYCIGFQE